MALAGSLLNRCVLAVLIHKPTVPLHCSQNSFQSSHNLPRSLFLSHPNARAPTPTAPASNVILPIPTIKSNGAASVFHLLQPKGSSVGGTLLNSYSTSLHATASVVAPHALPSGLKRWAKELAKGVWGYWKGGRWRPLAISARHVARLRRQTLLAGGEWPYDRPRKQMKTKVKGHKVDRLAIEKRKRTAELMEKMPQMLLDLKKRRWERKYKK